MLEVGLTGGVASGKSTVAAMFVELGAYLVDADVMARKAVEPGAPAMQEIAREFGPEILDQDGNLDRALLRDRIFSDPQARARLNAIVHPRVDDLINRELDRLRREHPHGVALVDVPLMFEVGWQERFQPVVVVYVPRSVQLARLMARDGATLEQAEKALNAQMPLEQKRSLAKFVVDNSGSLEETRKKVADIWEQLRTLSAKDHAG